MLKYASENVSESFALMGRRKTFFRIAKGGQVEQQNKTTRLVHEKKTVYWEYGVLK